MLPGHDNARKDGEICGAPQQIWNGDGAVFSRAREVPREMPSFSQTSLISEMVQLNACVAVQCSLHATKADIYDGYITVLSQDPLIGIHDPVMMTTAVHPRAAQRPGRRPLSEPGDSSAGRAPWPLIPMCRSFN